MAARKTRGPRTPTERAVDATRSTATRFEKLPPSYLADEYLKPIALLFRFLTGTGYPEAGPRLRDVREWEATERRFLDLAARFERDAELMPLQDALKVAGMVENVRRDVRVQKGRIAALLAGDDDG